MDILTLQGPTPLRGMIDVSGSKNAALPILIATLLTDEPCEISNVPRLADIETTIKLLVFLGKTVDHQGQRIVVTASGDLKAEAPYELVRKMRASVVVMGPLLVRLGRVKVSLPGGCTIGGRPIDIHLKGFESLGAQIKLDQGYVEATGKKLSGTTIRLPFASVGATENLMMAAVLSEGRTIIDNAAREPEITDLADFLKAMGARIEHAGTEQIIVDGVKKLGGGKHRVIADRIEAGTFMIAGALAESDLQISNLRLDHLESLVEALRGVGATVESASNTQVRVRAGATVKPYSIQTAVYPGFPTDLQAQWMALMTQAQGSSTVQEDVFENRLMHVPELQRMGAQIRIKGNLATMEGPSALSGADVMVSDLRAGAALVLGGLVAKGKTTIHRVYHLDRGYEKIEEKLRKVGAKISRSAE